MTLRPEELKELDESTRQELAEVKQTLININEAVEELTKRKIQKRRKQEIELTTNEEETEERQKEERVEQLEQRIEHLEEAVKKQNTKQEQHTEDNKQQKQEENQIVQELAKEDIEIDKIKTNLENAGIEILKRLPTKNRVGISKVQSQVNKETNLNVSDYSTYKVIAPKLKELGLATSSTLGYKLTKKGEKARKFLKQKEGQTETQSTKKTIQILKEAGIDTKSIKTEHLESIIQLVLKLGRESKAVSKLRKEIGLSNWATFELITPPLKQASIIDTDNKGTFLTPKGLNLKEKLEKAIEGREVTTKETQDSKEEMYKENPNVVDNFLESDKRVEKLYQVFKDNRGRKFKLKELPSLLYSEIKEDTTYYKTNAYNRTQSALNKLIRNGKIKMEKTEGNTANLYYLPEDKETDQEDSHKVSKEEIMPLEQRKEAVLNVLKEIGEGTVMNVSMEIFDLDEQPSFYDRAYYTVRDAIQRLEDDGKVEKIGENGQAIVYAVSESQKQESKKDQEPEQKQEEEEEEEDDGVSHYEEVKRKAGVSDRDARIMENTLKKIVHQELSKIPDYKEKFISYYGGESISGFEDIYEGDMKSFTAWQKMFSNPELLEELRKRSAPSKDFKWKRKGNKKKSTPQSFVIEVRG